MCPTQQAPGTDVPFVPPPETLPDAFRARIAGRCLWRIMTADKYRLHTHTHTTHTRLSQKFDPVAHPALLVYRGGDMVQCHLRLTDQLGYRFSKEDVESFFRKYVIFS